MLAGAFRSASASWPLEVLLGHRALTDQRFDRSGCRGEPKLAQSGPKNEPDTQVTSALADSSLFQRKSGTCSMCRRAARDRIQLHSLARGVKE